MRIFTLLLLLSLTMAPSAHAGIWDKVKSATANAIDQGMSIFRTTEDEKIMSKIEDIRGKTSDFIEYRKRQETAPVSAWLSKDKSDYQIKIEDILSDVEKIILDGEIVGNAQKIREHQADIVKIEGEIAGLREKQVLARLKHDNSEVKDISKDILELMEEIKKIRRGIGTLEDDIIKKFKQIGVPISRKQVQTLIQRIDGDDIVRAVVMHGILRKILQTTKQLMVANKSNMEYTKRYYAIYVILCETVVYAQTKYIQMNAGVWGVKLSVLRKSALSVIAKTRGVMGSITDPAKTKILAGNIEANRFTIKVIDLYKKMLEQQREKMWEARRKALQDVQVAWSSYDTASISAQLLHTINQADKAFEQVAKMEIPQIVPFANDELSKKFAELTIKLGQ